MMAMGRLCISAVKKKRKRAGQSLREMTKLYVRSYYNSVRERLREAFAKFGRDRRLEGVFPCSEWVKAEGALLGIVYEEGAPKYLCVAAEGSREAGPPAALAEHAMFVPETPFSDTVGFFVVFQSADTGEYVTVGEG